MPHAREKILERLQKALRDERLALYCYDIQCEEARLAGHAGLASRLEILSRSHARHVELIAARVRELGGVPQVFTPPNEMLERFRVLPRQDLCLALEHDLRTEDTQVETYGTLAVQSDARTAHLCETLTQDDLRHVDWLREELVRGRKLDPPE